MMPVLHITGRIVRSVMNYPDWYIPQNEFPLQYKRESGGILQINPGVVTRIIIHKQISIHSTEAGGVLLGRYIKNTEDVVIDLITEPSNDEHRTRLAYFRTSPHHQALLDDSWTQTAGELTYLGDWHTHPQCKPVPSLVDKENWHDRLEKDIFTESLFFLILGSQEIRIWEGKNNSIRLDELERIVWPKHTG